MADFSPVSKYVIARRLYNQRDFGQKYVKAYAYDPRNGETLLDGVEMTEKNSEGDFYYDWTLPDDVYGDGRQVVIWTVVYSDSGYTTRDSNYGDEQNEIRIIAPQPISRGRSVDYARIEKIISGIPKYEPKDYSEEIAELRKENRAIIDLIDKISAEINSLEFPSPINYEDKFNSVLKAIKDKEVTTVPEIDLSPIEGKVDELASGLEKSLKAIDELKAIASDIPNNIPVNDFKIVAMDGKKIKQVFDLEIEEIKKHTSDEIDEAKNHTSKEFSKDRKMREDVENTIFEIDEKMD